MRKDEIKKKLTREDIMMVAVTNEVDDSYVYGLLANRKQPKGDEAQRKAKAILRTAKRLAVINIQAKAKKQKALTQPKQ